MHITLKHILLFLVLAAGVLLLGINIALAQSNTTYEVDVVTGGTIRPGQVITVSWSAPDNEDISQDWIAIYERSADNREYNGWAYVSGRSGILELTVPSEEGRYQIRYLKHNGFTSVAESNTINAEFPEDDGEYTVDVTPRDVVPGATVQVEWSAPSADNIDSDWVAVYKVGDSSRNYKDWKYINARSGSFTLQAPLEAGMYEVRYLKNNGYRTVADSLSFTVTAGGGDDGEYSIELPTTTIIVGGSVSVTWSAPTSADINQDWIAIYRSGASNQEYLDWKYINGRNGSFTLTPPSQPGSYEIRYLKNNGFTSVAEESFTVRDGVSTGTYVVSVNTSGGVEPNSEITVTWEAPTNANLNQDWVAVYGTGSSNSQYQSWAYIGGRTGSLKLRAPQTQGDYEVRYLKNNGYVSVAKSAEFQVRFDPVEPQNIIALGDSLVAGFGSTSGNDFVSILSTKLGFTVENQGIIGNTTAQAITRLNADVLSKDPDIVIVLLGGNDFRQGVPRETTIANLRTIITRIEDSGAEVVLVGIHQTIYAADYANLANEFNVYFVPEVLSGILGRSDLTVDLVHPNNAGYAIVAERIYQVVRAAL